VYRHALVYVYTVDVLVQKYRHVLMYVYTVDLLV